MTWPSGTADMTDRPWVWLAHLPTAVTAAEEAGACLSATEHQAAARFKFDVDRARYIRTRGLLRRLLAAWLHKSPEDIAFRVGPHGRPVLEDDAGETRFNVSHSGDWALFGFVHGQRIGVDLEVVKDVPDLLSIARSNFTEAEVETLEGVADGGRTRLFHWLWTRKEACLKAIDLGIPGGLDRFEVLAGGWDPEEPMRYEAVTARRGDPYTLWLGTPMVRPELVASVAFDGDLVLPEVRQLGRF